MSIRSRVREEVGLFQRMRRYPDRGWIAGVCAGLADFFDWNVKLIRLLFVAGLILGGFFPAGVIYLLLWYLMEPGDAPDSRSACASYASGSSAGAATPSELKARFVRLEQRLRNMEACVTSHEFELRRELRKLEG